MRRNLFVSMITDCTGHPSYDKIKSMKIIVNQFLLFLLILVIFTLSGCKPPAPAEINYSAKLIITTAKDHKPSILEGKIAQKGKNLRIEGTTMGEYVITIVRPELNKTYLIYPDKKVYVEKNLDASQDYGVWMGPENPNLTVQRVKIGAERIEGHIAGIYKVTTTDLRTKETRTSTYWEAQDLGGAPLKIEIELPGGKMTYLLKEITPITSKELFEVPQGYKLVEAVR